MTNFSFTKIDVPAPVTPYVYISADGVDAAGDAVGNYGNVDGEGDGTFHGFTAEGGTGTTFDPPGSSNTDIAGITSTGEIFGDYVDFANKQHGFVVNNGVVTTIDVFLANSTTVFGVTGSGLIYGSYADFANEVHGFLDNKGNITQIDAPGATSTSIFGANASGTIVGTYFDAKSTLHGFVDSNGTFTSFDPQGSIFTSVVGISDGGEIAGNYQDISNNTYGFVDNNGVISKINIPGATSVGVQAINAAGEIVGYYVDNSSNVHGFIDNGGIITTIDVPGAKQTDVLSVNAADEIAGYYDDSSYNQHAFVGTPPPATVIESFGSKSLVQVGNNYFLDGKSTGTGPEVMFGGAPVVAGQIGGWTPIGAEATATGYEVALKLTGSNQYTVWNTDGNGNVTYDAIGVVSGTSTALESLESSFHQDLNGDGVIGIPATVIESFGSTSLVEVGGNFFMHANGTATGPELMYGGAPVVAGQIGGWTPIGAEATATGYEVALKLAGSNQYTVWNTDGNGNVTYDAIGVVSGTSTALESLEPGFHQDLNGDGMIGIPAIESFGSTSLVEVGNNFFMYANGTTTGPELMYGGGAVVAGQIGGWTPIGAEATATGYEVALKLAGTTQYTVWNTDGSGNVTYDAIGVVSGNSTTLESLEPIFHQDLNGDGAIGIPPIESSGSTSLVLAGNAYLLDSNSTGTGPELKYDGAPLLAGQWGSWTPIGAEATATGYEIAWKLTGSDLYSVWNTDSNGNITTDAVGAVAGNSIALESVEIQLPSGSERRRGDRPGGRGGRNARSERRGCRVGEIRRFNGNADTRSFHPVQRASSGLYRQRQLVEFGPTRSQGYRIRAGNDGWLFRHRGRRRSHGERRPEPYRAHHACRRLYQFGIHVIQRRQRRHDRHRSRGHAEYRRRHAVLQRCGSDGHPQRQRLAAKWRRRLSRELCRRCRQCGKRAGCGGMAVQFRLQPPQPDRDPNLRCQRCRPSRRWHHQHNQPVGHDYHRGPGQ